VGQQRPLLTGMRSGNFDRMRCDSASRFSAATRGAAAVRRRRGRSGGGRETAHRATAKTRHVDRARRPRCRGASQARVHMHSCGEATMRTRDAPKECSAWKLDIRQVEAGIKTGLALK
jgi:hypothetical protein